MKRRVPAFTATALVALLFGAPGVPRLARGAAPPEMIAPLEGVPASLHVGPLGAPLGPKELERLRKGKILLEQSKNDDDPIKTGIAVAIVEGSPQRIFQVLRDYDHFPDFMPYMERTEVQKHEGDHWVVRFWIRPPLGIGARHYELDAMGERKQVEGVEVWYSHLKYTGWGDIKDTRAEWVIVPMAGGERCLIRYTIRTDPGGSIPTWIKNSVGSSGMPKIIEAIRKRLRAK